MQNILKDRNLKKTAFKMHEPQSSPHYKVHTRTSRKRNYLRKHQETKGPDSLFQDC